MRGRGSRRPADDGPGGTVRVEPGGHVIEVRPGESLIQAAWRMGYEWPTLCYGMGTCTACQCEILEGLDLLSDKTEAEHAMLGDLSRRRRRVDPRRVRLACQVRIAGDVEVRKPGVRVAEKTTTERSRP
ncbi:MAG TPA: 2Fe-2S iron-sulfur cluster-binding protein [Amycolatopsis sp.]|nr:2Fe-2S iron-sulfur cluster-binding protein [Amycolatopsis sp.]